MVKECYKPLISEEFTYVVVNSITSYITTLLCTPTHITVGVIIALFAVFCSSFVTSVCVSARIISHLTDLGERIYQYHPA